MKLIKRRFFWQALFFGALFFVFLLPPLDPDLGWHLTCGELILKRGDICSINHFSSLLASYKWVNTHLLYQVFIFLIYKRFGFWGLSFLGSIILTFSFLIFFSIFKERFWQKILAVFLITVFSFGVFGLGIRSQLFSFFYFVIVIKIILLSEKEKRWLFSLPLIFFFWVNNHGGFVLGLIPLSALFFLKVWRFVRKKEGLKNFKIIAIATLLTFFSTLLNPYGFGVYKEAFRHFIFPLNTLIAEWVSPSLFQFLLICGFFLFLIFLLLEEKTFKLDFLKISLFFFLFLSFKARRNVPYFYLLFFLNFFILKNKKAVVLEKASYFLFLGKLVVLITLFWGIFIQFPKTVGLNQNWQNFCQKGYVVYPCQAVSFLKKEAKQGNLFNRYEWGGFLIWQLPQFKVFVDGRMPAWPTPSRKSPYSIYLETLQTKPGWQETLDRYNIDWILISPETFVDLKLKPNPKKFGWQEVFRDEFSVVYQREI